MVVRLVTLLALKADRPPAMAVLQWDMVGLKVVVVLVGANKAQMANGIKPRRARTLTMDSEVISPEQRIKVMVSTRGSHLMDEYGPE